MTFLAGGWTSLDRAQDVKPADVGKPESTSDCSLPDSDDGWIPTSSWAPPYLVKDVNLIGDEAGQVKAHLEMIEEPPAMEHPWLHSQEVEVMSV